MKLIACPLCGDVTRLIPDSWRMCLCGASGGQYNRDGMTATLGGMARVFGVANPFFNDLWPWLPEEKRVQYRAAHGYGPGDCWWGEFKGDIQIFRVSEAAGPRLRIRIESVNLATNRITITDQRSTGWTVDGVTRAIGPFAVPSNVVPSFKGRRK